MKDGLAGQDMCLSPSPSLPPGRISSGQAHCRRIHSDFTAFTCSCARYCCCKLPAAQATCCWTLRWCCVYYAVGLRRHFGGLLPPGRRYHRLRYCATCAYNVRRMRTGCAHAAARDDLNTACAPLFMPYERGILCCNRLSRVVVAQAPRTPSNPRRCCHSDLRIRVTPRAPLTRAGCVPFLRAPPFAARLFLLADTRLRGLSRAVVRDFV